MVRKSGPFGPLAHCSGQHAFVSLAISLLPHSLKLSWSHNLVNSIGCYPSAKEFGLSRPDFGCKTTTVGGISVRCKTRLQVPDSRVRAWSHQSCLRRDKIQ